jgi:GDP-D-mannose dehydratase
MWLMLQQPQPDDYVIAAGEMHSVRKLCEVAVGLVGLGWERHVRIGALRRVPIAPPYRAALLSAAV